jgi:hypothetical protein
MSSNEHEYIEELLTLIVSLGCNVNIAVCLVEWQVNISQSGA